MLNLESVTSVHKGSWPRLSVPKSCISSVCKPHSIAFSCPPLRVRIKAAHTFHYSLHSSLTPHLWSLSILFFLAQFSNFFSYSLPPPPSSSVASSPAPHHPAEKCDSRGGQRRHDLLCGGGRASARHFLEESQRWPDLRGRRQGRNCQKVHLALCECVCAHHHEAGLGLWVEHAGVNL